MPLSLLGAMTRSGVFGRGGELGRPLPGRTSIVITRQRAIGLPAGVLAARNLDEALAHAVSDERPFVIGGGEIYALALPQAGRMYVTWVEAAIDGDTRFPAWDPAQWRLVQEERHSADAKNQYDYTFAIYDRVSQEHGACPAILPNNCSN
jgi:dihydrofolate reductase